MVEEVMLKFTRYECSTEQAYLVRINEKYIWLPKKMCRGLVINKKLGGNVRIPAWLYCDRMGLDLETSDLSEFATVTIEKHIPAKVEPVESKPDGSLIR